ncbi:MAG: sugar ABC transporter ATP-binding protein [Clostridia bacterium]|nr:sugar ABC transporter ATP-binding protein [Clostridia bacterium]
MSEYILQLKNISKYFFGVPALKNINLELRKGKMLGLIGENGAGKSTMMNIIGGVIKADEGSMVLKGEEYQPDGPGEATDAGITFIHQELNLFTNLSIEENIYISSFPTIGRLPVISKGAIRTKTRELLDSIDLKLSPDILVEKLSPGERQLVEIAKALSSKPDIIIFDEPTTSLTARETKKLFELINKLRDQGISMIYISHILDDVLNLVDDIVVLKDGEVTDKGAKQDFSIQRMVSSMVGRDLEQMYPERTSKPSNEVVLEVSNLSQSGTIHDVSFKLHKGEILGVFGLMGSGRTEMARIIFGLDPYESGEIAVDGKKITKSSPQNSIRNRIAFVTENRREEGLLMHSTILDNIQLVSLREYAKTILKIVDSKKVTESIKDVVKMLKVKSGPVEKTAPKSLSGGNQQKVVIGKWVMAKPKIFMVDEPTRGIDVGAKYEVYTILNQFASEGSGVLIISSEIEELIGVCDRILVMSKGEIVGEFSASEFDKERIVGSAFRQNVRC